MIHSRGNIFIEITFLQLSLSLFLSLIIFVYVVVTTRNMLYNIISFTCTPFKILLHKLMESNRVFVHGLFQILVLLFACLSLSHSECVSLPNAHTFCTVFFCYTYPFRYFFCKQARVFFFHTPYYYHPHIDYHVSFLSVHREYAFHLSNFFSFSLPK
jgi:hypothetical protein